MFVIFLVQITSHRNSETRRKHLYRNLFTSSVFLLLTQFFDAFQGKNFRLGTVCLYQRVVIRQFIRKSCFLDCLFACWLLRKVRASLFAWSFKFRSELATDEVVLYGTIRRLDSKIRSRECSLSWLILERTNFGRNKIVFVINSHRFCRSRFL